MLIKLILIGKTDSKEIETLFQDYNNRLKHYVKFDLQVLQLKKSKKAQAAASQLKQESELILNEVKPSSYVVLLDEKGKEFTSKRFATHLQKLIMGGGQEIIFVIGGAYGFSPEVYARANQKIALSQMTFTHQMVRLIFIEQLYRAFTILKGEKYHH